MSKDSHIFFLQLQISAAEIKRIRTASSGLVELLVKQFEKQMGTHTYHMFNPTVLSFCVFSDGDQIHIGVRRLIALDGHTRTHIGIQVEGLP